MSTVDVGMFRLLDPPPGLVEKITAALGQTTFPWDLLAPYAASDPDGAYLVRFLDLGQAADALYEKHGREIHFSTRYAGWEDRVPFSLVHEIGHLADYALLTGPARKRLLDLMHVRPLPSIGHFDHDHQDARHVENWRTNEPVIYQARIHEAWADVFVLTYGPAVWPGYARFVHHSTNTAEVRRIITEGVPMEIVNTKGGTRYETAEIASLQDFTTGSTVAVHIVAGDAWPDGMVAAKSRYPGPVLYVPPASSGQFQAELGHAVREVTRLKPYAIRYYGNIAPAAKSAIEAAAA